MNHSLYHLENHLIPSLPKIIDEYLLKNPEDKKYFFDSRFSIKELLSYLARHFDLNIKREQFRPKDLLDLVLEYLNKKGIKS